MNIKQILTDKTSDKFFANEWTEKSIVELGDRL